MKTTTQARLYYVFTDFFNGTLLTYLPLYIKNRYNYSGSQLGFILMIAGLFAILGILIGPRIVNYFKKQKYVMIIEFILMLLALIILIFVNNFYLVMLLVGICYLNRMAMYSIGDNMIGDIAKKYQIPFGKFRSFGSIGWGLCFLVNGFLIINYPNYFILFWIVMISFAIINLFYLKESFLVNKQSELFSKESLKQIKDYKNAINYIIIACLIYICIQTAPNFINFFIQDINGSVELYSTLTAVFVFIEFLVMSYSHKLSKKLKPSNFIKIVGFLLLVKMLMVAFAPNVSVVYLSALIDPIVFGLVLPFNPAFLKESVPFELNFKVLSIFGVISLIVIALYSQLSGIIMDIFSSRVVFIVNAFVALLIITLTNVLNINNREVD